MASILTIRVPNIIQNVVAKYTASHQSKHGRIVHFCRVTLNLNKLIDRCQSVDLRIEIKDFFKLLTTDLDQFKYVVPAQMLVLIELCLA